MALEAVLGIGFGEDSVACEAVLGIEFEFEEDSVALDAVLGVECGEYGSVLHILTIR